MEAKVDVHEFLTSLHCKLHVGLSVCLVLVTNILDESEQGDGIRIESAFTSGLLSLPTVRCYATLDKAKVLQATIHGQHDPLHPASRHGEGDG
mmetsp:Transcript_2259/g.15018  ORF Transcript_2259/g.15018 Transcript_2259/m.15018 type:complete len:93 (+) Transcript_2259:1595-1873(+)